MDLDSPFRHPGNPILPAFSPVGLRRSAPRLFLEQEYRPAGREGRMAFEELVRKDKDALPAICNGCHDMIISQSGKS